MPLEDKGEQSVEQSKESSTKADVLGGDEVMSARQEIADSVKSDIEERKRDYNSGKRRITSSYDVLKDLAVSIFDGAKKLVGATPENQKDGSAGERRSQADLDRGFTPPDIGSGGMRVEDLDPGFTPADAGTGGMRVEDLDPGFTPPDTGPGGMRVENFDPGFTPEQYLRGDSTAVGMPPAELDEAAGDSGGEMGRAGDRSRDAGLGKQTRTEVETDEQGRPSDYRMPDGTRYQIKYGDDGEPSSVTITPEKSSPITFEKNKKGEWRNPADPDMGLEYVSFDKNTKRVTVRNAVNDTVIGPDGSFEEKNWKSGKVAARVDADGTAHTYDHDKGTETATKPDSHISEVRDINGGAVKGYEIRDDQGHTTQIELEDDGSAIVTKGDLKISYDKVERDANGDLKFTNNDKSSVEMRQDGTEISRDRNGKITKIVNSDGETTEFKRVGGKVTGLTVTDGQGKVVETRNKGIEVDDATGNYTVKLDKAEAEARKADGAEGTADRLERKADGTERLLAKDGTEVKSDADKLMEKFKNFTPEQQRQLRQDLADIDKLPPEQRQKVYESLDKIARNDEHPGDKIRLTGQQARELVQSLAHQIAHPESIQQGDKMTCVLANAEQTMARNHPEVYADMVAKLATEGRYTTHDGKTIEAQTGPDGTSLAGKTDWYGQRSYTSELFQNGVANLGLPEGAKYESLPPGDPRLSPRPAGVDASTDTGERVRYPDGKVTGFEGLGSKEQAEVLNHLVKDGKYGPVAINSPEDLDAALKKNGGPPLNVGISLGGGDLAKTGMGAGEGASLSGYHAVNITHFDKGPPAMVYYENPAGGADHSYPHGQGVPAEDFIKAMHAGKTEMKAVVKGAEGAAAKPGGGKMGNPEGAAVAERSADESIGQGSYDAIGRKPHLFDKVSTETPEGATVQKTTDEYGLVRETVTKNGETVLNTYDDEGVLISKASRLPDGRELSVTIDEGVPVGYDITESNGFKTSLERNEDGAVVGTRTDARGKVVEKVALIDGKLVYEDVKTHAKRAESLEPPSGDHVAYRGGDLGKYDANTGTLVKDFGDAKVVRSLADGQTDVVGAEGFTMGFSSTGEMSWQNPESGQAAVTRPDGTGVFLRGDGTLDRWGPEAADNAKGEKLSEVEQDYLKKHPETDLRDFAEIHRRFHGDAEKLDAFYKSLEKIDSAKHLTPAERAAVQKDIMDHVANPAAIYQGVTDSCNVTVIQRDLAITDPAKYASTVAEAVSDGTFTAADGTKTKLDVKNLTMADSSGRDLASRIFQGAALQAEFAPARKYENTPDGIGRLRSTKDSPDGTPKVEPFTGLYPIELAEIRNKITGEEKAITFIKSEDDLKQALELNGGPPMTIMVDATHAPFGDGDAPTAPNHVVTITGIENGPPVKYLVQNQYGLEHDHSTAATAIPANQLLANMSRHKEVDPNTGNSVLTTDKGAIVITKGDPAKGYTIVDGVRTSPQAVTDNIASTSRSRTKTAAAGR